MSASGSHDGDDLAFVVVGGYEYAPGMNQPATMTVRELARRYRVLNLHNDAHGSVLRRLQGRASHMGAAEIARTVFGSMRPRRVEEHLWLAPVRGLAAIGSLSAPEMLRRRNVRVFSRIIRGWLSDVGAERCVLVFYWWALPELVSTVPHVASIYDCTDDHAVLPGALLPPGVVERLERRLLDAVDRSFVVSPALLEQRDSPGRQITVLPNGFDLAFFNELRRKGFAVPEGVRSIPRPIVGYAGYISPRLDWDLLVELARRRPDWNFVFVGGDPRSAPERLARLSNVFFHRSIPYPDALAAISRFDVGIIPARVERFSRGNSFLKLLDYFVHGIPVVATPLPDTSQVAADRPGLLQLAADPGEWEAAIAAALEEPADSPLRDARVGYVEERSVDRRVARMISETLEHARASNGFASRTTP